MLIAIDPCVFVEANHNDKCQLFLTGLNEQIEEGKVIIAVDRGGKVLELYNQRLEDLRRKKQAKYNDGIEIKTLTEILSLPKQEVASDTSIVSATLQSYNCTDEIERALIGMAVNTEEELVIILAGSESNKKIRKLYNSIFLRHLQRVLKEFHNKGLYVRYATETELRLPIEPRSEGDLRLELNSRIFELLVRNKLLEMYPGIHFCDKAPERITNEKGEIDIWGVEEYCVNNIIHKRVWIGECKLCDEINENTYLNETSDIGKLIGKVKFSQALSIFQDVDEWVPFVATNHKDIHKDLKATLREIGTRYYHAILQENWSKTCNWEINELILRNI